MEELLAILSDLRPDVDFSVETALVDDGVLDSIDIVSLIAELSDRFDLEIPAEEIVPENFNSAAALWAMLQKLDEA